MERSDARQRFNAEVWPHAAMVLRVSRCLTSAQADAEDLAQETLLKAFRFIVQLRPGTDAKRWLLTILRNSAADRRRASTRQPREMTLAEADSLASPSESVSGLDSEASPEQLLEMFSDQQVIDALRALPDEIRWTLLLVDVEQLDQADAAAVLDVPVGTIKSRVHRGRAMLRERLMPPIRRPVQR